MVLKIYFTLIINFNFIHIILQAQAFPMVTSFIQLTVIAHMLTAFTYFHEVTRSREIIDFIVKYSFGIRPLLEIICFFTSIIIGVFDFLISYSIILLFCVVIFFIHYRFQVEKEEQQIFYILVVYCFDRFISISDFIRHSLSQRVLNSFHLQISIF